jgi:hypothetical protein
MELREIHQIANAERRRLLLQSLLFVAVAYNH